MDEQQNLRLQALHKAVELHPQMHGGKSGSN